MTTVRLDQAILSKNRSKSGVAIHEAGHFTVARQLGFQVKGMEVRRDNPRSELYSGSAETVIIAPIANDSDLENYLKCRIMVLNAGALAQAFDGSSAVSASRLAQIRADNAGDDRGKAHELFAIYLNRRIAQDRDNDYAEYDRWEQHPFWLECEQEATTIVRENWTAIERIASDAERVLGYSWCYERTTAQLVAIGWPEGTSDVA